MHNRAREMLARAIVSTVSSYTAATLYGSQVTVDVRSPQSGTIKGVHASEGDTVEVGAGLFDLDTDGGAPSAAQLDDKGSPSKGSQAASPPSSPAAAPSPETGSSPSPSSPSGT